MGSLQAYASHLSQRDDIALNGIATAATNETAEVVLGGSIAIPAAVVFFGVSGAMAVAQGGSFNLGFATMPVVFQQMPAGQLMGAMWFGLLFFAGITSSVSMLTPITAFFREEFGWRREPVVYTLGAVTAVFGLLHVIWLEHGFLDEWDYWAGTFGLVVFAVIEVIVFVWVFGPERAWSSIHEGADIRIPRIFKFIMTFVTPVYLLAIMITWGVQDAWPILTMQGVAEENRPYIVISRLVMLGFIATFAVLIRMAWKRNRYDDRVGFVEVENTPAGAPPR
jgi:SNF family Na+-dependent transporter